MQHFCFLVSSEMDGVQFRRHIDSDLIPKSLGLNSNNGYLKTKFLAIPRDSRMATMNRHYTSSAFVSNNSDQNQQVTNMAQAKRCLTSAYADQRRHWWKVCWFYNSSFLLESLSSKYSTLHGRTNTTQPTRAGTESTTLPRGVKLCSSKHYLQMPRPSGCSSEPGSEMVTHSKDHGNKFTLHCHPRQSQPISHHGQLTESKSMTTLETKPSLFSFPSQLKLMDKNLQKEMARFCSQQLNPSQLIHTKITQPLAILSKSKIVDSHQTNIVNMLEQYKGTEWRHRQLHYQMPIHDIELFRQPTAESKFIRNKQRKALVKSELFLTQQSSETCQKCKQVIDKGIHSVKITLFGHGDATNVKNSTDKVALIHSQQTHYDYFHIDCFTCFECEQVLVDLKAYLHPENGPQSPNDYKLFCSRHFVEIYKPRCPSCDKLIFDEECTEAEGKAWHIGHFCCTECKRSLGGQQYIMASSEKKDYNNDKDCKPKQLPYCLTCFDILFGELCEECGELIGCEVGAIIHDARSWHASDSCFRCSLCLKSLLGKPFLPAMDGRIYCSVTCSQAMISHQKERIRRQNKLQNLHSHKTSKPLQNNEQLQPINGSRVNGDLSSQTSETPNVHTFAQQSRDNFIKSMTLDRYEKHIQNSREFKHFGNNNGKLKVSNLTEAVNYEQFIKQNNQCFTSKYDWSREQEFLNVINSNNHDLDKNLKVNDLMQQFITKCDLTARNYSNSLDRKMAKKFNSLDCIDSNIPKVPNFTNETQDTNIANDINAKVDDHYKMDEKEIVSNFSSKSASSSQNLGIHIGESVEFPFSTTHSSKVFFEEKTSSLNSPSSSNETAPIWTISPPPDYSKLDSDLKDESSSTSSFQQIQNLPQNVSFKNKINGILKSNSNISQDSNSFVSNNLNCVMFNETQNQDVIHCTPQLFNQQAPLLYHSTPNNEMPANNLSKKEEIINVPMSNPTNKSNTKSVSFDPSVEDKDENRPRSIRRIRSLTIPKQDECDSHSCSSCSTCSSSSSSDDEDSYYDLTNFDSHKSLQIQSKQRNESKKPKALASNNQENSDACIIS